MSAPLIVAIFVPLAILAGWSILGDLRTGVARDELYSFAVGDNPIGFLAVICGKLFVIGFGIAMVLHACGLPADPVAAMKAFLGPFG